MFLMINNHQAHQKLIQINYLLKYSPIYYEFSYYYSKKLFQGVEKLDQLLFLKHFQAFTESIELIKQKKVLSKDLCLFR